VSRLKNYARGVASSYAQLAANVVYSLVSIPLALAFLSKAEFGLWALLMPLVSYLSLVDLGMTSAISRLLIDHKDERERGEYGALVKTAFMVGAIQGAIIFGIVAVLSAKVATLFHVPPAYQSQLVSLFWLQGAVSAFAFAVRPFGLLLTAHQRMDLWNYGDIFSLVASLGWLWLFLAHGFGVLAFAYANAINAVLVAVYLATACKRLRLFPSPHEMGRITAPLFRSVFGYGKDVFLVALGTQMIVATQPLIISRILGLEATATWSVGTKMFTLASQLVTRITITSLPVLAEMIVRQERERLLHRFKILVAITSSTSAFLGISLALCNSAFVTIWTGAKITWPSANDILLCVWLCILSVQAMHNNLVLSTKQVGMLRYVFFAEGCAFIGLAIVLARYAGITGVIAASILCTTMFSFSYGVWRNSRYFAEKPFTILFDWTKPGLKMALILGTIAIILWMVTAPLASFPRLAVHCFVTLMIGGFLFLRLGIPTETQRELVTRLPAWSSQLLARIFPKHVSTDR